MDAAVPRGPSTVTILDLMWILTAEQLAPQAGLRCIVY